MSTHDVIIIGLGGMGSAALHQLAKRGADVLGLEQFDIAHDRGSSHGQTRIIRKGYFEHPDYIPLLNSAYALWADLEADTGQNLFERCGIIYSGFPDGSVLPGIRASAKTYNLDIQTVPDAEFHDRFPGFARLDGMETLYEPDAGFLRVEPGVQAHADRAVAHRATILTGQTVQSWSADAGGVQVKTAGTTHTAAKLVITAGAWSARLLAQLRIPLVVKRKILYWYPTEGQDFALSAGTPVFSFDTANGFFYGFPALDPCGVKMGDHIGGQTVEDPDHLNRTVSPDEADRVNQFLAVHMPKLGSTTPTASAVCMYTMTPDENFIIDRHPEFPNVAFAAGFSGHGYKFAPVIGEILADLALTGKTDHPIDFLSLARPELAQR
jgi:sarcosine oxidase